MKKFLKFKRGEKGFTLIELLIVVAILGILAAVLVPALGGFLSTGQAAAANTEVANVETAALAYYADNNVWPPDSDSLTDNYTSKDSTFRGGGTGYGFDAWGKVGGTSLEPETNDQWPPDTSVVWVDADHKWTKAP